MAWSIRRMLRPRLAETGQKRPRPRVSLISVWVTRFKWFIGKVAFVKALSLNIYQLLRNP